MGRHGAQGDHLLRGEPAGLVHRQRAGRWTHSTLTVRPKRRQKGNRDRGHPIARRRLRALPRRRAETPSIRGGSDEECAMKNFPRALISFLFLIVCPASLWAQVQGQWTSTGGMQSPRELNAQLPLSGGRALSVGGVDN